MKNKSGSDRIRAARARWAGSAARRAIARFRREEDGGMTIFSLFMIMCILVIGGVGVDTMRNEMMRTHLQHTLDRAVLAAADLDQELDPSSVVQDYFSKSNMGDLLTGVSVDEGLNYRVVSATAETATDTQLMHIIGIDELPVLAAGEAMERVANVEISMVLDISGSMRHNNKMPNLRDAAKTFVDAVIREETEDLISISIVPYTAHVNAGPLLFDKLNVNEKHSYSHCVEFEEDDFDTTALDLNRTYEQGQHVEWSSSGYRSSGITNPDCPKRSYERITSFSQNASALKSKIDKFRPRANTTIHIGMKWGTALLDPSFRTLNDQLITEGEVDAEFSGRPVDYDDPETLKTVILMTDGENVTVRRVADWAYNSPSEYSHWNRYPFYYYLYRYVSYYNRNSFYYTKYTPSYADSLLDNICDAAKDAGIVIWTIGFEVGNHGANVMENCASSPSHFFRVEGIEITEAFEAIARQINQLRLTQ